jgi:hypothetical protein
MNEVCTCLSAVWRELSWRPVSEGLSGFIIATGPATPRVSVQLAPSQHSVHESLFADPPELIQVVCPTSACLTPELKSAASSMPCSDDSPQQYLIAGQASLRRLFQLPP